MKLLQYSTSRRRVLVGSAVALGAAAVIPLVGCGDQKKEDPKVTRSRKAAETNLLIKLSEWGGEWNSAILTSIFALTLSGRVNKIRLANGYSAQEYLGSVVLTDNRLKSLEQLDQIVTIELASGNVVNHQIRNSYLAAALERGLLDIENHRMAKSLLLNQWLEGQKKADPAVSRELRSRLERNRQAFGWSVEQVSISVERTVPNTDTNALCALAGVAGARELIDKSRSGSGWRHYVLNSGDAADLYSTIWASWTRDNMSDQTLEFVLSHQTSDGSFAHIIGGETTEGATAEALAYFASRDHKIFGRSSGS